MNEWHEDRERLEARETQSTAGVGEHAGSASANRVRDGCDVAQAMAEAPGGERRLIELRCSQH